VRRRSGQKSIEFRWVWEEARSLEVAVVVGVESWRQSGGGGCDGCGGRRRWAVDAANSQSLSGNEEAVREEVS
jgi:hypothetical protein